MLEHLNSAPADPGRVVVLGGTGFVGRHAVSALKRRGIDVFSLGTKDVDLLADGAAVRLGEMLRDRDVLVVVSAIAPCKTAGDLARNVTMMANVCAALEDRSVAHVIYVSSDAVYEDEANPIDERTPMAPASLHGHMHAVREGMLRAIVRGPLAILRPSLLYGADDPHNGYGPNRFRRLAAEGKPIVLFGDGEERRDHVLIEDVGEIVALTVVHRSQGTLNVATGKVISFREIAEAVAEHSDRAVDIRTTLRQGPMPHGGFRAFDVADRLKAFPVFRFVDPKEGIAMLQQRMKETR